MSAVDNKHLIEILAVNKSSGIAKKTGNPWEMWKAQCVVKGPDQSIQIGELNLPKSLVDTAPGKYLAEFELGVSFERMVVPMITKLHAWSGDAPAAGAARPAAAAAPKV
jgi:hypothetical protein